MRTIVFIVSLVLASCSPAAETADDLGTRADGMTDLGTPNGDDVFIATEDATPADTSDAATSCSDACAALDLTATVGAQSAIFDRSYFGLTAPAQSASGQWEVHVEVYAGGADGCPSMDSPTPDQTLIVTGMPIPEMPTTIGEDDGLVVSLLDFAGTLTMELPLRGEGEELRWAAWQICTDCSGDDPQGYVAFDVTAPLDGGEVSGHVYATHCASLDSR